MNQNGTLVGSPPFYAGAPGFGSALFLDGATQYVALQGGTSGPLSFAAGASFTVVARIRLSASPSLGMIVGYSSGSAASDIWFGAGGSNVKCSTPGGQITGTAVVNDGAWHNVALVVNGSTWTIYVDGVSDATNTSSVYGGSVSSATAQLGQFGGGGYGFPGALDEVAIYGVATTAATIINPSGPVANNAANLAALYHLDGDAADSAGRAQAANPQPNFVAAANPTFLSGLSPLNWQQTSGYVQASVCGASLRLALSGATGVALGVDTSALNTVIPTTNPSSNPVLAWSVDGGAWQTRQLKAADLYIALASSACSVIDLYVKGVDPAANRYLLPGINGVRLTGLTLNAGAALLAPALPAGVALIFGDSISGGEGVIARDANTTWPLADDGNASYTHLLAGRYGLRDARAAYGGNNWGGGLSNIPALPALAAHIFDGASRPTASGKYSPMPTAAFINLGENGAPTGTQVADGLAAVRALVNPATPVIVIIPLSGASRAAVTSQVNAYLAASGDAATYLVDGGTLTYATSDGQHPTAEGHQAVYNALYPLIDPLLPPMITSPATATATVGQAFSYQIAATGSPTSFGLTGTLPPGLTLNTSTGLISGMPTP